MKDVVDSFDGLIECARSRDIRDYRKLNTMDMVCEYLLEFSDLRFFAHSESNTITLLASRLNYVRTDEARGPCNENEGVGHIEIQMKYSYQQDSVSRF